MRTRNALVWLLIACMLCAYSANAVMISGYEDYLSELIAEFELGEYESALAIYAEIQENWPDPARHTGGAVDYAQYAKGRVYMAACDYTAARLAFSSLREEFPGQAGELPTAGAMFTYCDGWVNLRMGDRQKALECFYACRGTLDASALYEELSLSAQSKLSKLRVSMEEVSALALAWEDGYGFDNYSVSYAPVGAATGGRACQTNERAVRLDGLLPGTRYAVSVAPISAQGNPGIPVTAEFQTLDAPDCGLYGMFLRSASLCQYNARIAKRVGMEMIIGLYNNGTASDAYTPIEDEVVPVPVRKLSGGAYGYFVRYSLQYDAAASGETVRVTLVLRPEGQGAYALVDEFELSGSAYTGRYAVIDDLLDEAYENLGEWPLGYAVLDYYVNDQYLGNQYLNLSGERSAKTR